MPLSSRASQRTRGDRNEKAGRGASSSTAGSCIGATFGCIVEAARAEAVSSAVCLSTDAMGIAIQPLGNGKRQPCRKGHFFVTLADKDYVFPRLPVEAHEPHGLEHVQGLPSGGRHVIYDALFKGSAPEGAEDEPGDRGPPPIEAGCFAHPLLFHPQQGAFVAAGAMCERDVPPFVIVQGDRARVRALNVVGLERRGVPAASIAALRRAFSRLWAGRADATSFDGGCASLDRSDPWVALLAAWLTDPARAVRPSKRR